MKGNLHKLDMVAGKKVENIDDTIKKNAKLHPYKALGIAAGFGVIIGWILGRKK